MPCEIKIQAEMCDAKYALRWVIIEATRMLLSENLTIEDIAVGQIINPDALCQFFTHLWAWQA